MKSERISPFWVNGYQPFSATVKRPAYSVLDKTKIKETFGLHIPYWMESLKVCLSRL